LTLPNEEIVALVDGYEKESKALRKSILTMCWYMRGSISFEEAMIMGHHDREIINEIIEQNLDTAKTTGLPFF
jgi:hypothetical protein